MGVRMMREILDHFHGTDSQKLWLLAFAESASDRTREGWPGRGMLAIRTGRSPTRVSHLARDLENAGIILRTGGGRRNGGPSRYRLAPLPVHSVAVDSEPVETLVDNAKTASDLAEHRSSGCTPAHPEIQGALWPHPVASQGAPAGSQGAPAGSQGAHPPPLTCANASAQLLIEPSVSARARARIARDPPWPQEAEHFIDVVRRSAMPRRRHA